MAVSLLAALLGFRDTVSAAIKNMTLDELKRAALQVAALDGYEQERDPHSSAEIAVAQREQRRAD